MLWFPVLGSHDLLELENQTLELTGKLVCFPSDLYNVHIITPLSGNISDFIFSLMTESAILGLKLQIDFVSKDKR